MDIVLNMVLPLLCGLALFLFGMDLMGDSLKKSAGSGLKAILGRMTSNPVKGFLLGLGVTAIIQSSSATTVMVVGFVNSGTMTLLQAVGVIMGANVGTAVTAWITGLSGVGGESAEGVVDALSLLKPDSWVPIVAVIAICLIMCAIAYYRPKEARAVAVDALVYSAVSILLGGAMTALFYFFNRIGLDRLLGSEEDADGVSVWLFALIAIAGAIGTAFGGRLMRKKATRRACRVSITLGGRTVTLDGICDSGNLLREPISALPCIIIDPDRLDELIGRGDARAVIDRRVEDLSEGICRRVRVIPMRTVGGESVGYGIRADRVRVELGRETRSVEAFILAANEPISADGARALVPSELL